MSQPVQTNGSDMVTSTNSFENSNSLSSYHGNSNLKTEVGKQQFISIRDDLLTDNLTGSLAAANEKSMVNLVVNDDSQDGE